MTMNLQQVSDHIEIQRLRHEWSWAYDAPDLDGVVDVFAEDAVLDFGPYGRWVGIDQIRDGYANVIALPDNPYATFHIVVNEKIDISGDTAKGKFNLLDFVLDTEPNGNPLKILGIYDDTYVRIGDSWKISGIELSFMWSGDAGRLKGTMESTLEWQAQPTAD